MNRPELRNYRFGDTPPIKYDLYSYYKDFMKYCYFLEEENLKHQSAVKKLVDELRDISDCYYVADQKIPKECKAIKECTMKDVCGRDTRLCTNYLWEDYAYGRVDDAIVEDEDENKD